MPGLPRASPCLGGAQHKQTGDRALKAIHAKHGSFSLSLANELQKQFGLGINVHIPMAQAPNEQVEGGCVELRNFVFP